MSEATFYESDKPIPSFAIIGPANGLKLERRRESAGFHTRRGAREVAAGRARDLAARVSASGPSRSRRSPPSVRLQTATRCSPTPSTTVRVERSSSTPDTHLLMRVERIGHWKHKGDRLEWRTFTDYVDRDGIQVPLHSEAHVEDSSGQHNVISEITKIEFGAVVNADEFTIPEAYRAGFEGWTLQEAESGEPERAVAVSRSGKGRLHHRPPLQHGSVAARGVLRLRGHRGSRRLQRDIRAALGHGRSPTARQARSLRGHDATITRSTPAASGPTCSGGSPCWRRRATSPTIAI